MLLAHPGDTPQGDHLLPGDFLCENEVGVGQTQMHFITDKFTADDVRTIAGGLGQQLLEVEGHGPVFLADSAGMVSVAGVSLEHIQPDVLANLQDSVVHQNPQNVPGNADSPNLSGYQFSGSSWSVSGDLNLNNAVLLVQGDLNVGGSIKGLGTVIATGNITAAGAQLQAAGKFALAAGGALNLP